MITKWTEEEDKLLIQLRKKNIPYKALPEFFKNRSQDACRNRAWVLQSQTSNTWLDDEIIGVYDIETTNLKANVGFCLSWYMICSDGKEIGSCIKRKEILNGKTDERVIKEFLEALKNVDVLVGYYNTNFDNTFMRTRAEVHGYDFPSFGSLKNLDLFYTVRSKLNLTRKSLGAACEALGIGEKTHEPIAVWNKARIGHQKSIDAIYKYNKNDVRLTYELFERLKKYRKFIRRSI